MIESTATGISRSSSSRGKSQKGRNRSRSTGSSVGGSLASNSKKKKKNKAKRPVSPQKNIENDELNAVEKAKTGPTGREIKNATDSGHTTEERTLLISKTPAHVAIPQNGARRAIRGSRKAPSILVASSSHPCVVTNSMTSATTPTGAGNTDKTGHADWTETHSQNDENDTDTELIHLYPRDTEGSSHIFFENGRALRQNDVAKSHTLRESVVGAGRKKQHIHSANDAKDPTIKLTSPGRLPKWMLLRSRDSLFCPRNMLFEKRKKGRHKGSRINLRNKTVAGVRAIGTHFSGHDAAMEAKLEQAKMKAKSRASQLRKMRRARRAQEKSTPEPRSGTRRPSSAATDASASSHSSALMDNPTRLLARLEALNKSSPPPPPGWQEHLDLQTGRVFYVEVSSGKTTWVNPGRPRPRRVESRGMVKPVGVRLHTPASATRVQQDWREYLPPPETCE